MQAAQPVESPKIRNWKKETWSKAVRAMQVGDQMPVEADYSKRMSQYVGAKRAFPGAKFSVQRQDDGSFLMTRTA